MASIPRSGTSSAALRTALPRVQAVARAPAVHRPGRHRRGTVCELERVGRAPGGCLASWLAAAAAALLILAGTSAIDPGASRHGQLELVGAHDHAARASGRDPLLPRRWPGGAPRLLRARAHGRRRGPAPRARPEVCVQLPMFNEHAVARRVIEAACAHDLAGRPPQVQVSTTRPTPTRASWWTGLRACGPSPASTAVWCGAPSATATRPARWRPAGANRRRVHRHLRRRLRAAPDYLRARPPLLPRRRRARRGSRWCRPSGAT